MSPRRPSRRRGRDRGTPPGVHDLPAAFRERMASLLGTESEAFLEALVTPAAGLRVNTLRLEVSEFREISPFELRPLPYPPEGFLVDEGLRPGAHPFHAAGLYYLQDPGAMVVGALPDLPPDPRVLDLAAAPGGKATHLAARMAGRGMLVANDVHAGRARELAGNLERCGARNAIVTSDTVARLAEAWPGWFDLVLVDAPCSGESMFHKSEAARREWSPEGVAGCARRQGELLRDAVRLVRPGGTLLYSTCTFAAEENEMVLAGLLDAHPELRVAELPGVPGAARGRPDWAGSDGHPEIDRALRLWPHRFPGAGHFVAALQRGGEEGASGRGAVAAAGWAPAEGDGTRLMRELIAERVPGLGELRGEVIAEGDELYLLPPDAPAAAGVRVLRPGWWLGTARKDRFEPSHALAMGIGAADAADTLLLESDSPEAAAYLRGEAIRRDGPDGWVLVCVHGFPLGWGKRSHGVVKNHYPKGLRRS